MTTTTHYGQRCRKARESAGLSLVEARDRLRDSIPRRYVPSVKTLSRIENGETPEDKVDGIVIVALARMYEKPISELSRVVADELEIVRDLVIHTTCCILA